MNGATFHFYSLFITGRVQNLFEFRRGQPDLIGERGLLTRRRYSSRRIASSAMPTLMSQAANCSRELFAISMYRVVSKSYLGVSLENVPRVSVEEHFDLAGRSYLDHSAI